METFSTWLESQFLDWQKANGRRSTINEFSDYLGVSRSLVSYWLNGNRTPSPENVAKIADKLGPIVYDLLDEPRPDPDLKRLEKLWPDLPESERRAIADQVEKYVTKNETKSRKDPARKLT